MKKPLLAGVAVLLMATSAHALDLCKDPDYGKCLKPGKQGWEICHRFSTCCKNAHDWSTQWRDKTTCKKKAK